MPFIHPAMPNFIKAPFVNGPEIIPQEVAVRLLLALMLGAMVAGMRS